MLDFQLSDGLGNVLNRDDQYSLQAYLEVLSIAATSRLLQMRPSSVAQS